MRRNLFRFALALSAIWFLTGRADAQIVILPPESPDLIRGSWSTIDPPSGTFVEIFTLKDGTADFLKLGSVLPGAVGLPASDLGVDLRTYRTDPPPNFGVRLFMPPDPPGISQLQISGSQGVAVFDIANAQIDPVFSDPTSGRVRIFADASFNQDQSNIIGFDLSGFTNGGLEIIYLGVPTFGIVIPPIIDGYADYTTNNGAIDVNFRITTHPLGVVPEPGTAVLLAAGLAGLGLIGLRRRSRLHSASVV